MVRSSSKDEREDIRFSLHSIILLLLTFAEGEILLHIFSGRHSCTEDKSVREKHRSEFDKTENPSKYSAVAKETYNQTSSQGKVRYKMKTYELFTF